MSSKKPDFERVEKIVIVGFAIFGVAVIISMLAVSFGEDSSTASVVQSREVVSEKPPLPQQERLDVDEFIIKKELFACEVKENYKQILRMAAQQDQVAFSAALGAGLESGECVILKEGQKVFVQDTEILSGLIQVRPQGETKNYWVKNLAIRE